MPQGDHWERTRRDVSREEVQAAWDKHRGWIREISIELHIHPARTKALLALYNITGYTVDTSPIEPVDEPPNHPILEQEIYQIVDDFERYGPRMKR